MLLQMSLQISINISYKFNILLLMITIPIIIIIYYYFIAKVKSNVPIDNLFQITGPLPHMSFTLCSGT